MLQKEREGGREREREREREYCVLENGNDEPDNYYK
jgi:hypothetical protein